MRHSGYEDTKKDGAAGANPGDASFYIRHPQPRAPTRRRNDCPTSMSM